MVPSAWISDVVGFPKVVVYSEALPAAMRFTTTFLP
jgi:hypothetical protein